MPIFLLIRSVNHKNKAISYFTSKNGLFGNRRELQFGTYKSWQNQRQDWRTEERKALFSRGKRVVGRDFINKKSIGIDWELEG